MTTAYDATYIPCQTLGLTGTYPAFVPPAPNATYRATITKIEFLEPLGDSTRRLVTGEDAVDLDHLITPEERLKLAMAIQ